MKQVIVFALIVLCVAAFVCAALPIESASAQGQLPVPCLFLWCTCDPGQVGACDGGCAAWVCSCYFDPGTGLTVCITGPGGGW